MASNKQIDLLKCLKAGLEPELKKALLKELVDEEVERYRKIVLSKIEPIVERLTIKGINNMTDFLNMTENIHIQFSWDNKDERHD